MRRELSAGERVVAGAGVFVAGLALLAVAWQLTPWHMGRAWWIAALGVTGGAPVALLARRPDRGRLARRVTNAAALGVVLLGAAGGLGATAFVVARDAAIDARAADPYSQLWARADPARGLLTAFVRNADRRERFYRLRAWRDGRVVYTSSRFGVRPGATLPVTLALNTRARADRPLDIVLRRADDARADAYRLRLRTGR